MNDLEAYRSFLDARIQHGGVAYSETQKSRILDEGRRVFEEVLEPKGLDQPHILLAGGAGYIGVVVTEFLLARGYRVRCLDRIIYTNEPAILSFVNHPNYEFVYGDLCDPETLDNSLSGITDVVILAGLVGDPITKKFPEASAQINERGIQSMINGIDERRLNKVLFISTCSNYGHIQEDAIADETHELKPLSLYATAKVAAEKLLLNAKGNVDFCGTALRFATAFGLSNRMRFDLTLNEFTRELFLGNELEVYDPDTWRPYCHVRDFADVICRVLEAPAEDVYFEVFNAGGDENNRTKRMIVEEAAEFAVEPKYAFSDHGSDPRNYRVDFQKIRERLGFTPSWSVTDGITEIAQALRSGLFHNIDAMRDFYGNYDIDYDQVSELRQRQIPL